MAKKLILEDLAAMVSQGFKDTASRIDLNRVEQLQKDMLEELNATHEDVRYLKDTVSALVRADVAHEDAIDDLNTRVHRLEQKTGLGR